MTNIRHTPTTQHGAAGMLAPMTERPPLALLDPLTWVQRDYDSPRLAPMPINAYKEAPREDSPAAVWDDFWALPKGPLTITAELAWGTDSTREPGPHHLDAALSVAMLRASNSPWTFSEREARVIPLPLALLGVVQIDEGKRTRKRWPILPVWASTPFAQVGPGRYEALCVGHLGAVSELLTYLHELGATPARFSAAQADMAEADALAHIRQVRPMPGRDSRWTPPYWYDWENRAEGGRRD